MEKQLRLFTPEHWQAASPPVSLLFSCLLPLPLICPPPRRHNRPPSSSPLSPLCLPSSSPLSPLCLPSQASLTFCLPPSLRSSSYLTSRSPSFTPAVLPLLLLISFAPFLLLPLLHGSPPSPSSPPPPLSSSPSSSSSSSPFCLPPTVISVCVIDDQSGGFKELVNLLPRNKKTHLPSHLHNAKTELNATDAKRELLMLHMLRETY